MKLQFKVQEYQTAAVDAVIDCFAGQPKFGGVSYRIDPGRQPQTAQQTLAVSEAADSGLRNAEIVLNQAQLLENIHGIQRSSGLPLSKKLEDSKAAPGAPNLDIEMETGTGKTYVYIKTMMELHQRYGWSKFIVTHQSGSQARTRNSIARTPIPKRAAVQSSTRAAPPAPGSNSSFRCAHQSNTAEGRATPPRGH
jgi:restriction endonuclease